MYVKLWIVRITVCEEIKADDHAMNKIDMNKKGGFKHGNLGMDSTC